MTPKDWLYVGILFFIVTAVTSYNLSMVMIEKARLIEAIRVRDVKFAEFQSHLNEIEKQLEWSQGKRMENK